MNENSSFAADNTFYGISWFFVTLGARYYIKPLISGVLQTFYRIQ